MRYHVKFRDDRSNHCRVMAVFRFLKMAAVRHLGFVVRLFATTYKEQLVVFIVVYNLVGIGRVVMKL